MVRSYVQIHSALETLRNLDTADSNAERSNTLNAVEITFDRAFSGALAQSFVDGFTDEAVPASQSPTSTVEILKLLGLLASPSTKYAENEENGYDYNIDLKL